jgi:hypothetical protein
MALLPVAIRKSIPNYTETYRSIPSINGDTFITMFVQHNYRDNSIVSRVSEKDKVREGKTKGGVNGLYIAGHTAYTKYKGNKFVRTEKSIEEKVDGKTIHKTEIKLYMQTYKNSRAEEIGYTEIPILGNKNNFLDFANGKENLKVETETVEDNTTGVQNNDLTGDTQIDIDEYTVEQKLNLIYQAYEKARPGVGKETAETQMQKLKSYSEAEKAQVANSTKRFLNNQLQKLNIKVDDKGLQELFELMC